MAAEAWSARLDLTAVVEHILRHEIRAVEEGAHAFLQNDGSYVVRSATREGVRHRVTWIAIEGLAFFFCSCESGQRRGGKEPIVCWHAPVVARRLEREGQIQWSDGLWWSRSERE